MSGMRTPTPAAETAAPPCCWTCSIFQEPWGTHLPAARVQHLCKGRRAKASHTVAEMSCKHTMKFWKEAPTVVGRQGAFRAASLLYGFGFQFDFAGASLRVNVQQK